jgi:hypothetical protein
MKRREREITDPVQRSPMPTADAPVFATKSTVGSLARRALTALVASAALGAAACGPPAPPPYAQIQQVYTESCAVGTRSCHAASARFPSLAEGMSHAATVNVNSQQIAMPMVTPGSLERSYLWHKINGTMATLAECRAAGADCGTRMPMVGGTALTEAQVDLFRRWILAGAPRN